MTSEQNDREGNDQTGERESDGQDYVDRTKIDFDPDDGHYTGTAVEGTSEIPGPHEQGESPDDKPASGHDEQARSEPRQ